jgi:cytochrome c oxidase subunit 3/cytochrome o ubiquinol oxidase subunit 3
MTDATYGSTQPLADAWAETAVMPAALQFKPAKAGMLAFLLSEVAFFSTLITTYIVFLRETQTASPSPAEVFHLPLVLAATACLLSSSVTIHFAEHGLRHGRRGQFLALWGLTIILGAAFLIGTANEWAELIGTYGLTIGRNLFGSTYFTLVGFHAAHVTVGLFILSIVWLLAWRRQVTEEHSTAAEVVSWYWHFVDVVWIVVFSLVYLIGR